MKSITLITVAAIVFASCGDNAADLSGTWRLVADQEIDNGGSVIREDKNVLGQLIYTPEGNMSIQILWTGLRESIMTDSLIKSDGFPAGIGVGQNSWTSEQRGVLIDTYDGYFGTYSVDWDEGIITHVAEGDFRPQMQTTTYKRKFTLKGDTLFVRGVDLGLRWQVLWVRKKR